ncbi:LLM class flavin-dependent oxidoreductase [Oceanivirga miroungae]|uniref:Limonene 1,2-monooxygenase n=1 Tax=Oceanivirga miroungae TaxID=1130046 RepID=A0A6I8M9Z0_9FUSO|nr:LLM class flavin-dependent oxidoreductase [Oceanivirga miroungae]VWL85137.1 Limonene 1,2-monooxygenase [Oceanivirga miroungae]
MKIELGISTFGETTVMEDGTKLSHDQRIRNMIEEVELADKVGLDIYAVGEHHRDDFAVSSPEMILAAAAVKTKHIKLSSAVTVLSSNDPVRVYQNFSHVDALSSGRAEIMVGRGSFIESFPLFGYDLRHYDELFSEKLDMLLKIKENEVLTWRGKHTQSVNARPVYPRALDLPIWVATGGNPESTINIAKRGLPIVYAIIGGNPNYFTRLVELYKRVGEESGFKKEDLKVGVHSWGYVARDNEEAIKDYFHPTKALQDRIAQDRATWAPLSYQHYLNMVGEYGAMFVGSPEKVAQKLIRVMEEVGIDRFMLHLPVGSIPHEKTLEAIRLFGEEVAPIVRAHFENK